MIARIAQPILSHWDGATDLERRELTVVAIAAILFLIHLAWYSHWFIEDAAISFAYARNFANGEGFASYSGGEIVEGFSNPTWTLLLAALDWLGVTPWVGSKLAAAVIGIIGLPFAWRWARAIIGPRNDLAATWVPVLLAISPQYVAWAASGLENCIITTCMAGGGALLLRELANPNRVPWSALCWGILSISRPEAPVYAAIAGIVGLGSALITHGLGPTLHWAWRWGILCAAPFFSWHLYAYWTFAWEAPNTYFAKLHDDVRFQPWYWSGNKARSWGYIRRYAQGYGHGYLLWLYALGQSGFSGLRGKVAGVGTIGMYVLLLPGIVWLWAVWGEAPLEGLLAVFAKDGDLPLWPFAKDPTWLQTTRILTLLAIGIVGPAIGWGRPGAVGRTLAWWLTAFAIFFAIYAGGDWMKGMRWFNMCCVPLTILLVDAVVQGLDALHERGWDGWQPYVVGTLPLSIVSGLMLFQTVEVIRAPDTSPYDVRRRVLYGQELMARLDVERPVFLDVDMGAHQWFAGPESPIVDVAGLIDVPMGHHKWQRPFVEEYVFDERRPHVLHLHGGWARRTRITGSKRFSDEYLKVADFPASRRVMHVGNHVRRDLVFVPKFVPNADRRVAFEGGFGLFHWDIPSPEITPGEVLTMEVWWEHLSSAPRHVRPIVFLSSKERGVIWSKELPPAYDWRQPADWDTDELTRGVHRLTLPDGLPTGTFDLGLVVTTARGVRMPVGLPTQATPRFLKGEVRWPQAVTVREPQVQRADNEALAASILASDGTCTSKAETYERLRKRISRLCAWWGAQRPRLRDAIGLCWAQMLHDESTSGPPDAASERYERLGELGNQARWWAHLHPEVRQVTVEVAQRLRDRSRRAEATSNIELAYQLGRVAMELHPQDPWARRRQERLRDSRHNIDKTPSLSDRLYDALGWDRP